MAIPGFTAAFSFYRPSAHARRRQRLTSSGQSLEPAQYGDLFEHSIDELSRSTRRTQPPICFPLIRERKDCYDDAAIECIAECAGTGEEFHQICLSQCLSRRYRYCDTMNEICLPIRTSRRYRQS